MDNLDIRVVETPISILEVEQFVNHPDCGGTCLFIGTVRNQTNNKAVLHLEFETYEPMAIKEMHKIAEEILKTSSALKVAIHHRSGLLKIGEIAVVIAVACPHRKDSFSACSYAIDTLKKTVPIWKKEVFADGSVWVGAHP